MFRNRDIHVHFVGIGGIGMSGIAELLCNLGYRVSGTDLNTSEVTQRLQGLGAVVHRGHAAEHIGDADVVVTSSAIKNGNPEVEAARARHTPVIPRAEMLAELMRIKQGLLIAGSHGKTTTTSLVAHSLHHAGLDPTVVIGGKVNAFDSNARLGYGDVLVAEADESDGSFLFLTPTLAVITNIDAEHLDHYGSIDKLLDAFVGFGNRVPFYGQTIVCVDDANVRSILPRMRKRVVTYGLDPAQEPDYLALDIRPEGPSTRFRVVARDRDEGEFVLAMPGLHNVRNALACIALCDEQQVHREVTRDALANFAGVQRRFSHRGSVAGVHVYDDYGHHPTEIRATLQAARAAFPDARIVAAFQPHRYSRVRNHFDDFVAAFDGADVAIVTDIYPAGEEPIEGISGESLHAALCLRRHANSSAWVAKVDELSSSLFDMAQPGDLMLTLGAGNITRASTALVARLQAAESEG
jgi:UDP-N-acetylmuramate--alanine ligase